MANKISPDQVYAINQFMGVMQKLSRQGLIEMLRVTYHVEITSEIQNSPRTELLDKIAVEEYGSEVMEAFNVYPKV